MTAIFDTIFFACFYTISVFFLTLFFFKDPKVNYPEKFPFLVLIFFFASILQKVVSMMEETEHTLYNRVRAAEMQRRKQEQDVQMISSL